MEVRTERQTDRFEVMNDDLDSNEIIWTHESFEKMFSFLAF